MATFKQRVSLILIILLIIASGCDFISQNAKNSEVEELTEKRGVPEWLLVSHRVVVEPENNSDELKAAEEETTEPEPDPARTLAGPELNTANDREQPVADPDQKLKTQESEAPSTNEGLDQNDLDPSADEDVKKAKEALQAIEEEYDSANQERKVELMNRYNQIIRGLKKEYGVTYDSKLGENWWDLDMDKQPSLEHNIRSEPN